MFCTLRSLAIDRLGHHISLNYSDPDVQACMMVVEDDANGVVPIMSKLHALHG